LEKYLHTKKGKKSSKLQKTPSKVIFEGIFMTFRAKNAPKSEKW
jgi:hypothetical protein